jgi:hypothetical protein
MRVTEITSHDQSCVDSAVEAINQRFAGARDNSLDRNRQRRDFNDSYERTTKVYTNSQRGGFRNDNRGRDFGDNRGGRDFGGDNRGRSFDSNRGRNFDENRRNYGDNRGNDCNQNRRFQRDSDWGDNSRNQQSCHEPNNNNMAPVKRSNDDWEASEVTSNSHKTDDWEQATIPSVNVYTKSNNASQEYGDKSRGNYEKKFRPRDDYGSSRTFSRPSDNNYESSNKGFGGFQADKANEVPEEVYEPIDWDKINAEADEARKARWANCPLLLKDFYNEHPMTKAMTKEEIEKFRLDNNKIQVSKVFDPEADPDTMPKPITKFEYGFEAWPDLLNEIKRAGFDRPSPIQSQMWPILLKGEDCIGIAQTGTGKTLAFLLPALIHTDAQPHPRGIKARGGPNVLVLAPTRELAIQIEKEVAKYQFRNIKAVCLYGGNDRRKQIEVVESGVEVIIATPGRLNDLVAANHIKIESITYLILDEADR